MVVYGPGASIIRASTSRWMHPQSQSPNKRAWQTNDEQAFLVRPSRLMC